MTAPLASHYTAFRVAERCLLTGHSHQAWPDAGFLGQQRAWLDAAALVDDKWERAAEQATAVRHGFARLLGDAAANVALGQNTHELVARWLSALPLRTRPRIITTSGEFHTIRRLVDRLAEEAIEVHKEAPHPAGTLASRLAAAIDNRTACVMVSSVLFETAEIVPGLHDLVTACDRAGVALLVDAYHHLNVVPFDVERLGLASAFVTGGGYKYCQLGEGNAFLRVPPDTRLRPVLTGWYAEFERLERTPERRVEYGPGAAAFAGATYDPTAHYRAAAVFAFHEEQRLTPDHLHAINRRQVQLLKSRFEALDLDPARAQVTSMDERLRGGFLAIHMPNAQEVSRALRQRGVLTDARGEILRLGPAPYLRDDQLAEGIDALASVLRAPR